MNPYRNPFIVALWAPAYLMIGAVAVTNDFLMATMWLMATLGIIGAYVTEFHLIPGLYANEVMHKVAISSLFGTLFGMIIALALMPGGNTSTAAVSTAGKFFASWAAMSSPAYPLMVFFVSRINKRDLDAEHAAREEKRKNRKSSGPPILNRDGF